MIASVCTYFNVSNRSIENVLAILHRRCTWVSGGSASQDQSGVFCQTNECVKTTIFQFSPTQHFRHRINCVRWIFFFFVQTSRLCWDHYNFYREMIIIIIYLFLHGQFFFLDCHPRRYHFACDGIEVGGGVFAFQK